MLLQEYLPPTRDFLYLIRVEVLLHDDAMTACICYMACGVLLDQVMEELRLPLSTPTASFGIGVSSAAATSAAAYIASKSLIDPLVF